MKQPEIHYARSGEVSIAYQIVGEGPVDIVFARGFTGDLLSTWEQPLLARHVLGLAEHGRVLMLDKRGTGLSDRVAGVPTLEARMDDLRVVMDAVGSEQAVLWSGQEGTRMASLFAATYPERTTGLIVLDPTARGLASADYPWASTVAEWRETLRDVHDGWGGRPFFENDTAGDGFYATFDGSAHAIRCALEVVERVRDLDVEVRAGIHTGECEVIEGKYGGLTVSIGARVASSAGPSEVRVTQTVKDLVAGSGLAFEDADEHELKGVPDRWRLYRVAG